MSTVNMKKVGDVYEQDMDPFSEYNHTQEPVAKEKSQVEVVVQPRPIDNARKQMHQVVDNVDQVIEGVELMFEFGNKIAERFRRL